MNKELYIEGQSVELEGSTPIKRTYQANDLTKPEKVQANFTNTFEVLATRETRKLLGFADIVSAATTAPYKKLDASLISEGLEEVPYAQCEVLGYGGGKFRLQIYSGNIDFFDKLGNKSIQDLDLSEFHHPWTYEAVALSTANGHYSAGFVYDLVNRGTYSSHNNVYWADLLPSTYGRLILQKIIEEAGFTSILPNNELLDRLLIPVSKKYTYPSEFTEARGFRVGTNVNNRRATQEFSEVVPFNFYDPDHGFVLDKVGNYDPNTYTYTIKEACYMSFAAALDVRIRTNFVGFSTAYLTIRVNGEEKAYDKLETKADLIGKTFSKYLTTTTAEILLQPGDKIQAHFRYETTRIALGEVCEIFYRTGQPATFTGTVSERFPPGGNIELEKWLPNITQKDFFKFCLHLIGGMVQTDSYSNTITVTEMAQVERNQSRARDWSDKLVGIASGLEQGEFRFNDFGQQNFIRWKNDKTVPEYFGDASILCNNENLPPEKDIISLPFGASLTERGLVSIPMYKAPSNLTPAMLRGLAWQGTVPTIDKLNDVEDPIDGWAVMVADEETAYRYNVWAKMWEPLRFTEESISPRATIQSRRSHTFTLTDRQGLRTVSSGMVTIFEEELHARNWIATHYTTLQAMLTDTRLITREFRLRTADVAGFDFAVPVWLRQYGHFFYVNKIKEYAEGEITSVELIRL